MATLREDLIARAAGRLLLAARKGVAVDPVRDELGEDLAAAYEVQERVLRASESLGNPRVGRKVGLTSEAVQRQLGIEQPDFGVLLAGMDATGLGEVPSSRLIQPRIEAEIAFVLGKDVSDPAQVLHAVEYVCPALEIVDSRVRSWDISIVDTVADNASSGMFVLGESRRPLADVDTVAVKMEMLIDGAVVSTGNGSECMGDPRRALIWVAQTAHDLGRPLRRGEVILSGALGPMVPFVPGATVTARISSLGTVTATASKE